MKKIGIIMKKNLKYIIPMLVFALTLLSFNQQQDKTTEKDKVLISILKYSLTTNHYQPQEINDDFSIKIFNDFIEGLDPTKRYFLQSDIEEFAQYKTDIDNQIMKEDISFFNLVNNRFLERVENIKSYYKELLNSPYDFTIDEALDTNYDDTVFAKNKDELYETWRKHLKFSTLSRLHDKLSETKDNSTFEKKLRDDLLNNTSKNLLSTKNDVLQIQKILVANNFYLGSSGANKDGVDGIAGSLTYKGLQQYKKKFINDKAQNIVNSSSKDFAQLEIEARESTLKNYDDFYERLGDFDHTDWFATYLNSITQAFDPHTTYLPPRLKKDFDESISGKLEGIGAQLSYKNDYTKVVRLISGGPAWRAGELEVGDIILKVAQGDGEPLDIVGMRLRNAIEFIKGKKGTEVQLTLKKIDGSIQVISIIRDIVELEDTFVKSSIIEKDGKKFGVINLPKFYIDFNDRKARNCAKDMAIEIERLKKENIDGVLIDLRNNGGGSLPAVVEMAGLFIKDGPIVQVKYKGEKPIVQKDRDRSILWNGPMVVLTNEFSASASEIFAAALQDYKRAVIIGSKQTYGKGTVQSSMNLNRYYNYDSDLGGLNLTIQKFYRINGGSTQLEGVKPDIILPSRYRYMDIGEKDYDNPLSWDQIPKANYDTWDNYSNLDNVVSRSVERINTKPQFLLIEKNAKWLKKAQEDTTIYLNYDVYKSDIDDHALESKEYESLSKYSNNLTFNSPKYELPLIKKDSVLGVKRTAWHKNLSKDIYIEEGLNVLGDLKIKNQYQIVKN
ncbi:MAG: carboxyl-terminal processing protease [Candidatus Azotimanducaceae bacterium]|jgi:carboxyl-terminal processing protease